MPRTSSSSCAERSVAHWAKQISAGWNRSVKGIFGVGRTMLKAELALGPSGFTELIGRPGKPGKSPFRYETALRLMKIAEDKRLRGILTHGSRSQPPVMLPSSWRTLYELTLLSDEQLEHAVRKGLITAEMQRSDVEHLRNGASPEPEFWKTRDVTPLVRKVPVYVTTTPAPTPPHVDSASRFIRHIGTDRFIRHSGTEAEPELSREDIGRLACKLIQLDIDLARELYRLLWVEVGIQQLRGDLITGIKIEEQKAGCGKAAHPVGSPP